jgi:EAL domain-containing protein (putative c-di-GMP-specific phosphodiesterase class I)
MSAPRLAVIDDEPAICDFIAQAATECGFDVFSTVIASELLQRMDEVEFAVVILDLHMPGVDGIELLRALAARSSGARILLASGADDRVIEAAFRLGQERGLDMGGIIHKPIRLSELQGLVQGLAAKADAPTPRPATAEMTHGDLARAIEQDELVLHYQPQIDLASRSVVGVEALIRWEHPVLGLLPPAAFLPLAKSSGLIVPMTDQLFEIAIGQCGAWLAQGLDLRLSLNLSAKLNFDYSMPEQIAVVCERSGFAPDRLTLELTETAAMDDPVRLIDVLTRFRIKGFHLSIDDFGTAYSSLLQLQRLPFTELKVDKSFVMTMLESSASRVIVETIIGMAHNMKMKAVAEGIESAEVLEALAALRCEMAQGYFIARPASGDRIRALCSAAVDANLHRRTISAQPA